MAYNNGYLINVFRDAETVTKSKSFTQVQKHEILLDILSQMPPYFMSGGSVNTNNHIHTALREMISNVGYIPLEAPVDGSISS